MKQKRFIKLFRKCAVTRDEQKRCIDFMRQHNGFISYDDFAIMVVVNEGDINLTLAQLDLIAYSGVTKVEIGKEGKNL